jgi:hypothetical protein
MATLTDILPIPKGKTVRFKNTGSAILAGAEFLLEEDINLRLESTFKSIVDSQTSEVLTMAGGIIKGLTDSNVPVANKYLGYQQWAGTEPLSFTFQIAAHLKTDAYTDVVAPCKELMKIPLPKTASNYSLLSGELNLNFGDWGGLSAPGPDILSVILKKKNVQDLMDIQLGSVRIRKCIITGVDCNFSSEITTTGYPIWAKLTINAKTIFTANVDMIDDLFSGGVL